MKISREVASCRLINHEKSQPNIIWEITNKTKKASSFYYARIPLQSLVIYCELKQCMLFGNFHFGSRTFILRGLAILDQN